MKQQEVALGGGPVAAVAQLAVLHPDSAESQRVKKSHCAFPCVLGLVDWFLSAQK